MHRASAEIIRKTEIKISIYFLISAGLIPRSLGRRLAESQRIAKAQLIPVACGGVLDLFQALNAFPD
jgi:hypothetical protein